jgi:hypothetical protein
VSDEEEASDALLYPGALEEGMVWAKANREVKSSNRAKGKRIRSRSTTKPPAWHYSERHLTPAERKARLVFSILLTALLSIGMFFGLLFFLNR